MPTVLLKIASLDALERLRRLPFVDYLEPAVLSSSSETSPSETQSTVAATSEPEFSSTSSNKGRNYGHYVDAQGNWIPNIFNGMRIPEAWRLSTGARVNVGLLDTGIDYRNLELARWQHYKVYSRDLDYDSHGHGTHQAGVIGAPRNGNCVVGVAYGANHISVKHSSDYLDVYTWRVNAAMDTAVNHGAKVIAMSFRSNDGSNAVSDRIEKYYRSLNDSGVPYDVLFVAAAGSGGMVADYWFGVVFPASQPDVIAVSAIDYDTGQLHSGSHSGYQVELSAYHGQPTTGTSKEGFCNATSGNTSNSASIVAGIAALVRAKYPTLRNYEVRTRLRRGAQDRGTVGRDSKYGYGIVNAYGAVGGFYKLRLRADSWSESYDPCRATTDPTRTCFLFFKSRSCFTETFRVGAYGDGPFTYRWSTGSTSSSTSIRLCPSYSSGYDYRLDVTVTKASENKSITITAHIDVELDGKEEPM